jgi:hypothetical protein
VERHYAHFFDPPLSMTLKRLLQAGTGSALRSRPLLYKEQQEKQDERIFPGLD